MSVRFWDRFAERYAKQSIADPDSYRKKLDLTQRYLTPDSRVLEFGCGTGSTALIHAPKIKHIVAIDSSPKMIEIADHKKQDEGVENVEFVQATLFDLTADDGSFNAILGLNIIHLLDDRDTAIQKVHDLLKPAGVFVSSTVCLGSSMRIVKLGLRLGGALGLIPRLRFFSRDELVASHRRCGFTLLEQFEHGKDASCSFLIARKGDY